MRREIKFKVWDSISKCWHYWDNIKNNKFNDFDLAHYTMFQYTGLKDKNGTDIYEGDLMEVCENKKGLLEVEFKNEYVGGWVLTHGTSKNHLSLGARCSYDMEIKGNSQETNKNGY